MLEGELTFTVDGEEVVAGPGTFVLVPPGVPHGFGNRATRSRGWSTSTRPPGSICASKRTERRAKPAFYAVASIAGPCLRCPSPTPASPTRARPCGCSSGSAGTSSGRSSPGVLFGILWMVAQALMPFAIGRAIEDGIVERDNGALAAVVARPARPRRDPGVRRSDAPPVRGLQLAAGVVPARAGGRAPRRARRPGRPRPALDRRGRRDGLERRDARGRRVRHHRPALGRDRLVRRRRGHPAVVLGRARAWSSCSACRCSCSSSATVIRPLQARQRGPARGGRAAHGARRRHRRRPARAARDRRRAGVLRPLPRAARRRCGWRRPRRAAAVDAGRRAGASSRGCSSCS